MKISKIAPWNWFKNEEAEPVKNVPIERPYSFDNPLYSIRREFDEMFNQALRKFDMDPYAFDFPKNAVLKPSVDIAESDKEYKITVEVPGVDEDDVKLELANHSLTITGEKKQEKVEDEENYHRVERSYGSFRRVLTLPEDVDDENIEADFKNGVLTIAVPRVAAEKATVKKIDIHSAA